MKEERNEKKLEEKKLTKTKTDKIKTKSRILKVVPKLILPLIVVAILIVVILNCFNKVPQDIAGDVYPELARAMEYDQVQPGEEIVKVDKEKYSGTEYEDDIYPYVQFDAFFLRDLDSDGVAESVRGTCREIGKEDTLYIELKQLTNGYIKEGAKITLNKNRNFYLETAIVKDNEIADNYIGANTGEITLKQIGNSGNGVQKLLTGIVKSGDYTYSSRKRDAIGNNIENYSKENTITFEGIHVRTNEDGSTTEIPIKKEVTFTVDWYGTTRAEIPYNKLRQTKNIENAIDEDNKEINLEFELQVDEVNNQLILSKLYMEGVVPQLNGYNPKNVEVIGENQGYTYEPDTRKLIIQRDATLNENKFVTKIANNGQDSERRYNNYKLRVTYDLEAYTSMGVDTLEYKLPIKAYYEGYNNENEEFENPHKSNIVQDTFIITYRKPVGYAARFDITIGKYVSKPSSRYIISKEKPLKVYNGISESEQEDYYIVEWYANIGSEGKADGVIMKETENEETQFTSDQFIKTDGNPVSMEELSSFVGIYFSNPIRMLGEEGEIKVYDDETGNLLITFNKNNWDTYTSSNPYMYEIPIKHIRIETSETKIDSGMAFYNIKELDDDMILNTYEREEFDNLRQIKSTLVGFLGKTESKRMNSDVAYAYYEAPVSVANMSINKTVLSTQETDKNFEIKIETETYEQYNEVKWTNGAFLLKLPKDIIDVEINSVNIDNDSVKILSYEKYEEDIQNENGESEKSRFIKINTENNQESSYVITIDCNITPDPKMPTTTESIELYAYNENNPNYYYSAPDKYDVNDNLNNEEQVNKVTKSLNLVSPNSLLTSETASNYNNKGTEIMAPQIAMVSRNQKKATIAIGITNNYSNTISEIKILGKIPTKSNTYVINGTDMKSQYDTQLTGAITLPEELQEGTKIYYSEIENVTKEITDESNQWKDADIEQIDFTKVKSFLIDLQGRQLDRGDKHEIKYEIKFSDEAQYNQIAYSHHAVYFSLDTTEGKYRTQIEPNKLGFMIAKLYNFELTKYQLGVNKVVSGATYSIQEIEDNDEVEVANMEEGDLEKTREQSEVRTKVTSEDGKFTLKDLYVEKTYIIKEIKSPEEYKLNEDEIKFKIKEQNGELVIENLSNLEIGKTDGTIKKFEIQKIENENDKLVLEVQDEVRANLTITKVEKQGENLVNSAYFKIDGADTEGRILKTNKDGQVTLKGLYIGEEYTLQEIRAGEGYYLTSQIIRFKIVNEEGNYTLNMIEPEDGIGGIIKSKEITKSNEIPTLNITIENDKIPRYTLEITKVEKVLESVVDENEIVAREQTESSQTEIKYIPGAKFKLYKEKRLMGEYETDGTGKIVIEDLYAYEDFAQEDQVYTLKETYAPEGYAKVKDITFRVQKVDGQLQFQEILEEGQNAKKFEIDENTVKLTVEDSPIFKLVKKDKEKQTPLANIKFAIYNIDDGENPATNSKGEILGEKEIINGKEYYTLKTNQSGELTADLVEGLYKAVEVEAPEQYDISESIYYFGIGTSRESTTGYKLEWATSIGGYENGSESISCVTETSDGGYIVGGHYGGYSINLGKGIEGNDVIIKNSGGSDAMIIKYNKDNLIEWAKSRGREKESNDIISIIQANDGGYIGIEKEATGKGNLLKLNSIGDMVWIKELIDNSYGQSHKALIEMDDGDIICYMFDYPNQHMYRFDNKGSEKWKKDVPYIVQAISKTHDGGYIVAGNIDGKNVNLGKDVNGQDVIVSHEGYYGMLIVKYNSDDQIEWAKKEGGAKDEGFLLSVSETSDKGYIVGGYFRSDTIQIGNYTFDNFSTYSFDDNNGIIIKYDSMGNVEFATSIGGDWRKRNKLSIFY